MSEVCTRGKESRQGELGRSERTVESVVRLKSTLPRLGRTKGGEVVNCELGVSERSEQGNHVLTQPLVVRPLKLEIRPVLRSF